MENESVIQAFRGALVGLGAHLANLDYELFIIWATIAACDIIIGVLNALKNGTFETHKMRNGMINKIIEFLVLFVFIGAQLAGAKAGFSIPAASFVVGAFIFKDIASILETAIEGGIKIPKVVLDRFAISKDQFGGDKLENKNSIDSEVPQE